MTSEATRTVGAVRPAMDAPRPAAYAAPSGIGADEAGEAVARPPMDAPRPPMDAPRPAIDTPGGRFEFAPHNCFACGTLNENGLHLNLHVEDGRSWAEIALDRRFEGWEGVIHGGILTTILDEVMAWALVGADDWGVTARMTVDFKRPAKVGSALRADGWIVERRRRIVETAGRIVGALDDTLLATSTGTYLAAGSERKQDLRARYAYRPATSASSRPDATGNAG